MNKFQERLQELLDENGLNRLKLSKQINISFETLNGYFNKNFYPEISVAIKISKYFNCSIHYLLGLTDNEKSIAEQAFYKDSGNQYANSV